MGKNVNRFVQQMLDAGLPSKAITELTDNYIDPSFSMVKDIKIHPDPQVEGTFAVRVTIRESVNYRHDDQLHTFEYLQDIDLLWNKGSYDEVEFESWPPVSGDLKFF